MSTAPLSHPKYRRDIDGLRAVAVLSVVVFHAFPRSIRGGFTGVDIFFVISGFLISTILYENIRAGRLSIAEFYVRRVKRIFPALLLVMSCTLAFGWVALLGHEFAQLGKHVLGGAAFVSNLMLWSESGYFDLGSHAKPLLHLWSLAVEEQFYLVWPLVMVVAARWRGGLWLSAAGLGLVSFALNWAGVAQHPDTVFYWPFTRFWELLAGGLLAWAMLGRPALSGTPWVQQLMGWSGLLALLTGFAVIHEGRAFPGAWALWPVAGSVLLIGAGEGAWVNRVLLSSRPAVWIGLISYPLYLWHWPLLSFAHIVTEGAPSKGLRWALVLAAVVLAWLTVKLLESRIRHSVGRRHVKPLLGLMALVAAVGACVASLGSGWGWQQRDAAGQDGLRDQMVRAAAITHYPLPASFQTDPVLGLPGLGVQRPRLVLFLGDSHTKQYWHAVQAIESRLAGRMAGVGTLFSTPDNKPQFPPELDPRWFSDARIQTVVLSYFWSYRYGSASVNQAVRCCGNGPRGLVGRATEPVLTAAEQDRLDQGFESLVRRFQSAGKRVVLVLDNPFGEELDPRQHFQRSWHTVSAQAPQALSLATARQRTQPVRDRLLALAHRTGAEVIDPMAHLCDAQRCAFMTADGELMYKDYDHLSLHAAQHAVRYLDPIYVSR